MDDLDNDNLGFMKVILSRIIMLSTVKYHNYNLCFDDTNMKLRAPTLPMLPSYLKKKKNVNKSNR